MLAAVIRGIARIRRVVVMNARNMEHSKSPNVSSFADRISLNPEWIIRQ